MEQLRRVLDTINQRGQHAIIFGERGVGKTSLASVISSRLRMPDTTVVAPRVNCDSGDTYASLWKKLLSQIDLLRRAPTIGFQMSIFEETVKAAEVIGDDVTPDAIRRILTLLSDTGVVIAIFDEFDRIIDPMVRRTMADTIKTLSDHDVNVTLIIVGVADSVQELISEHESIERALVQTRMQRMSSKELSQIIDNGLQRLQMSIEDDAKSEITVLSQGLPHFTHLLGLHSTRVALDRESTHISTSDVDKAVKKALADVDQTIRSIYDKAVFSPQKDTIYAHVLLACALAKTGEFGFFTAASVRDPLSDIAGKRYEIPGFSRHLNDFCEDSHGSILHKEGKKRKFRFRFKNPLMQPLIIMKGLSEQRISKETLRKYY
jgi:Cdc6-like AAA superfamily ATPase